MKFRLGKRSLRRLEGVDPLLISLIKRVLKKSPVDLTISWMGGYRTADEQNEIFSRKCSSKDGYIKLSKHQQGLAFDFNPYVNGKAISLVEDKEDSFYYGMLIGLFITEAKEMGIEIRSGLDWNMNNIFISDQRFQDWYHIELKV